VATPEETYARPANVDVARLLGDPTINLLPVEPVLNGEGISVVIANHRMHLGHGYRHVAGTACILGLRPETVRLHGAAVEGSFPVEIVAETPLNDRVVYLMQAADGAELLAWLPNDGPTCGGRGAAHASFDPHAAHLFARGDGRRIERNGS